MQRGGGIRRRTLLAGAGTAAITVASSAAALPRSKVASWDATTDVLVAGSGAAGVSAALAARAEGARVTLIESLTHPGGSSAMSGGVVYAGGGTELQRALNVEDSVEQMFAFLSRAGGKHPPLEKIQRYCEDSVAHFNWLLDQGIRYTEKFTRAKGLPMGDESLYFSGTELAWPARELATPAPRGHVPGVEGMNGGRHMMEVLLRRARKSGVTLRTGVAAQRLVVETDGRIAGVLVNDSGKSSAVRVRRGIVLACGGFIHNREMLRRYAPELYDCSVPWGNAGDLGDGINMGIAVGAEALRMHQGFAITPVYPPEHVLSGIVVNESGQRFISEESYHGVLGDAIAYHQGGRAFLITDKDSDFGFHQDNFVKVAEATSVSDLAIELGLPSGALQHTVAYYNRFAEIGEDPLFQKGAPYLRPVLGAPYRAWDLSVDKAFFPAHTFGGLHTTVDGQVVNSFGEAIPGLYAAGRTTAGLPTAPYIASGLSVGDCTYFGRRAGEAVATRPTGSA